MESMMVLARLLVLLLFLGYLLGKGRNVVLRRERGWRLVMVGLSLVTLGTLVDLLDEPDLVALWPHPLFYHPLYEFVELVVGYFAGLVLIMAGVLSWLPAMLARTDTLLALKESELRWHNIFLMCPDAIVISRLEDGVIEDVNEGFTQLSGYAAEDAVGRSAMELELWCSGSQRDDVLGLLEEHGKVEGREGTFRDREGRGRAVLMSARVVQLGGSPHLITLVRDISERVRSQEELAASEEKYRLLVENVSDLVVKLDADGRFLFVSPSYCRTFGKEEWELLGSSFTPQEEEGAVTLGAPEELRSHPHTSYIERRVLTARGWRWLGWLSKAVLDEGGRLAAVVGVGRDVTQRRQWERQLESSLQEKEVLLKEVHHRVKNNLQVISGLLSLQEHHITDPVGKEIYRESQNRVISMALIHERLYQARDLSRINFGEYLRDLGGNLMASYGMERRGVSLELEVEDVELVVDTAIPCGLIVNELVSNALKHAFPEGDGGTVRVGFSRLGEQRYLMTVEDDGVGMPEGVDPARLTSLGMQLVTILSQQLGGELEQGREGGTRFALSFSEYREAGTVLY